MSNYYTSSGKMSPIAMVYFLIAAFVALPILALIYSYAIWYIPIIYVNLFLAVGFGMGIAFIMNLVVRLGKIRSTAKALVFGVLGALIAYYIHWVVWADLLVNAQSGNDYFAVSNISISEVFSLALQPGSLLELIGLVNESGTWGFGDTAVSGTFLSIVWLIEFLIIIGFGILGSYGAAAAPFCEISDEWFDVRVFNHPFARITDIQGIVSKLEAGDDSLLADLGKWSGDSYGHSTVTIYDSKHNESYMSIDNQIPKKDDNGKITYDAESVISYVKIKDELVSKMEDRNKADAIELISKSENPA